jgi:hypothetical protein
MLPEVLLGRHCCAPSTNPDNYRPLVGDALIDEIDALAKDLAGVSVCQINATAAGGGVAELLGRQIPILRALGVDAEWRLIHGNPEFFALTKSLHNALQGQRWTSPRRSLGVIQAYQLVKAQRPEVQLALVGAMAGDDPEGWAILETINREAAHDSDIYVFTNPDFKVMLHTVPIADETPLYYLWHLQILPRVNTIAGFELGSGMAISTRSPGETAAIMRDHMAT